MSLTSIFRLASATKIWTTVLALTYVDEGKIGIDDPLSVYLPEWSGQRVLMPDGSVRPATRAVTVRDLFRHTAGLGYGFREPFRSALVRGGFMTVNGKFPEDWSHQWTLREWSNRIAAIELEDEPGTRFSYGLTHDVLGLLIERVSGKSLPEAMNERVLEPLGLGESGFFLDPGRLERLTSFYRFENGRLVRLERGSDSPFAERPHAPSGGGGWDALGNGGMVSSARDFARLLEMVMSGGEIDGIRVLTAESAALMFTNQLSGIGSGDSFWPGAGFGLGYAVLYDTLRYTGPGLPGKLWWAGSTNVHFWVDPRHKLIGVLMTHMLPFGHADVMDAVQRMTYAALP